MNEPLRPADPSAALERALIALGRDTHFPPAPDLAASVRRRLREPAERRRWWHMPLARQPLIAALLLTLALLAGLATLLPDVRTAIAHWFTIPGVHFVIVDDDTATGTLSDDPAGATLLFGERLTLTEAQARVPFMLQLPTSPTLGMPDEVYLRPVAGSQMVTLLYQAQEGLPAAAETGVGALLMQFENRGPLDALAKGIPSHITLEWPTVGGGLGLWLEGSSYLMVNPGASLGFGDGGARHSANVLFWQENGVTFRLETALTREDAIRLAESVSAPSNND